jgi:hypothetical protein
LLVNHVDAPLAANNFAAGVLGLDGCFDFHVFISECLRTILNR